MARETILQAHAGPLFGADLRARRAKIHITSLKRHLSKWAEMFGANAEALVDDAGTIVDWRLPPDFPLEVLGRTGVWIGEAVYNMRSALDYLVFAIASIAHGQNVPGTQFPIEDDMNVFWGRVTGRNPETGDKVARYLRHVPHETVLRLSELQPGSSPPCEWTRKLRELSNMDKHRHMANLTSQLTVLPGHHPDLIGRVPEEERDQPHVVIGIYFGGTREDVIDTLDVVQRSVRSLIDEFKPAFKRLA